VMDNPTNAKPYLQPRHDKHRGLNLNQWAWHRALYNPHIGQHYSASPEQWSGQCSKFEGLGGVFGAYCVPRFPRHRKMPPADRQEDLSLYTQVALFKILNWSG